MCWHKNWREIPIPHNIQGMMISIFVCPFVRLELKQLFACLTFALWLIALRAPTPLRNIYEASNYEICILATVFSVFE